MATKNFGETKTTQKRAAKTTEKPKRKYTKRATAGRKAASVRDPLITIQVPASVAYRLGQLVGAGALI